MPYGLGFINTDTNANKNNATMTAPKPIKKDGKGFSPLFHPPYLATANHPGMVRKKKKAKTTPQTMSVLFHPSQSA